MTSGPYRVGDLTDISGTLARRRKEMKDSAVVPHAVSGVVQLDFRDVGNEPMDTLRGVPQTSSVCIDGALRNIEDGNVLESVGEKVIDQCGFTAADIDLLMLCPKKLSVL